MEDAACPSPTRVCSAPSVNSLSGWCDSAKVVALAGLKVWLGFVKLQDKIPAREPLRRLLYGSATASAEDADVVALFLTDLVITKKNAEGLRHTLKNTMGKQGAEYIFNEDDRALVVRHIPAQLIKVSDGGGRFVSMCVAVHKRSVQDSPADVQHFNCFPVPGFLTCKSGRKNELEPSTKSIFAQEVLLRRGDHAVDLLLLGANLDTDDEAKLGQLESLERLLLKSRRSARGSFCAFMWGNFNNRIVAYEDLKPHVVESQGKYRITDAGARLLVHKIEDPTERHDLLQKDSLRCTDRDIAGNQYVPARCNDKLRELFITTADAEANFALPLPSYKRQPLDSLLSQSVGCRLRLKELVCSDSVQPWGSLQDLCEPLGAYFGWEESGKNRQRKIKTRFSVCGPTDLYLQCGWLDGVGVWRDGSAPTKFESWETDLQLRAFDHLPMRSVISINFAGEKLKVWLGFVKLEGKFPARDFLQQLLYGSTTCSAENADVVALFFTDLVITKETAEDLRHMLKRTMGDREKDYFYNEDDRALVLRHIPAQLVTATEAGVRYVSMSVAVHRRNAIVNTEASSNMDCFPIPVSLRCKSAKKNELEPSAFKSILTQEVVLYRQGEVLELSLLGANLETDDDEKLGQVMSLERLLRKSQRGVSGKFCALLWGDFNNRLVASEDLKPHVISKEGKEGKFKITETGARYLVHMFNDPVRRREMLQRDSMIYTGRDIAGRLYTPPACNVKLRELFSLTAEADVQVPWPSYKVQPLDIVMSKMMGCSLQLQDAVYLPKLRSPTLDSLLTPDHYDAYFGWDQDGKPLQREIRCDDSSSEGGPTNLYLQLGWSDGFGVYKGDTVDATIVSWETEPSVQAFDHLPVRLVLDIDV